MKKKFSVEQIVSVLKQAEVGVLCLAKTPSERKIDLILEPAGNLGKNFRLGKRCSVIADRREGCRVGREISADAVLQSLIFNSEEGCSKPQLRQPDRSDDAGYPALASI